MMLITYEAARYKVYYPTAQVKRYIARKYPIYSQGTHEIHSQGEETERDL